MRTLALLGVLVAAAPAAATTPLVPSSVQQQIHARAGALAYAPARAPFGYRYSSFAWNKGTSMLTIRLHDRRYSRGNHKHDLTITAGLLQGPFTACGEGNEQSYQVDGNKVFSAGGILAWRCVKGTGAKPVKLSATGASLPASALAITVSSVRRI